MHSLQATCDWIDDANRRGDSVRPTGDVTAVGQRHAGDAPNVYSNRTFTRDQLEALDRIPGLRFVPFYAARGFLSPGFERLLTRHLDRTSLVLGPQAEQRLRD